MDNSLLYNYIYTSSRSRGLDCKSSAEHAEKDYVVWSGGEDENLIPVGWWQHMESFTSCCMLTLYADTDKTLLCDRA